MKRKIIKIGIVFGLVFFMTGVISAGDFYPDGITPKRIVIDCGSITINTGANPDVCLAVPIDHLNIDVGQSATVVVNVDFSISCPGWDDTGFVDIKFDGTTITDSAQSGGTLTGELQIEKVFYHDQEFTVVLHAKIDYTYSDDIETTQYSYCSTAPWSPPTPILQITPSSYDYSSQKVHTTSSEVPFTLQNIGTGTAYGNIYLSDTINFRITGTSTGSTTFSLIRDASMTIWVVFQPQSTGAKYATLTADGSNCGDVASYLSGVGTPD